MCPAVPSFACRFLMLSMGLVYPKGPLSSLWRSPTTRKIVRRAPWTLPSIFLATACIATGAALRAPTTPSPPRSTVGSTDRQHLRMCHGCARDESPFDEPIYREMPGLRSADLAPEQAARLLSDPGYWRNLCPEMHVGDAGMLRIAQEAAARDPDPDLVDLCRDRMQHDGYFDIPAGLEWVVPVARVAAAIQRLCDAGWPPSFVLLYDEAWVLMHQAPPLPQERVVCERNRDPSRTTTPAGGLSLLSCWSCDQ